MQWLLKVFWLLCSANKRLCWLKHFPLKGVHLYSKNEKQKKTSSLVITAVGTAVQVKQGFGQSKCSGRTTWCINASKGQLPPHHQRWWKHTITVTKCQGGHGSQPLLVRVNNVCSVGCMVWVCACVCVCVCVSMLSEETRVSAFSVWDNRHAGWNVHSEWKLLC